MRRPRIGVRRVRWGFVSLGLLALVLLVLPAVWILRDANWRTAAPVLLLAGAVDFGDRRSADELVGRCGLGSLSENEVRTLAARGLAAQGAAPLGSTRLRSWMRILGELDERVQLNDDEWQRMVRQAVRDINIRLRERTRVGDALPAEVFLQLAAPPDADISGELRLVLAGEDKPRAVSTKLVTSYVEGTARGHEYVPHVVLLRHTFERGTHAARVEFYGAYSVGELPIATSRPSERASERPDLKQFGTTWGAADLQMFPTGDTPLFPLDRRQKEVQVVVMSSASEHDCYHVRGPEVRAQLQELLAFRAGGGGYEGRDGKWVAGGDFPLLELRGRPTWPIEFEVHLRQGEARVRWGMIRADSGETTLKGEFVSEAWRQLPAGPLIAELTPSAAFARSMMDVRFVDEAVELGPIELRQPSKDGMKSGAIEFGTPAVGGPTSRPAREDEEE